jgi:hypothetical protein
VDFHNNYENSSGEEEADESVGYSEEEDINNILDND